VVLDTTTNQFTTFFVNTVKSSAGLTIAGRHDDLVEAGADVRMTVFGRPSTSGPVSSSSGLYGSNGRPMNAARRHGAVLAERPVPCRRSGSAVPAELLRLAGGLLGDHDVDQRRAAERHRRFQRALQIFRVLDEPALPAKASIILS